jgi:CNT family concentrative nucleoside transporter
MATGPLITDAEKGDLVHRTRSSESASYEKGEHNGATDVGGKFESDPKREEKTLTFYSKYRPYILSGVAAVILGWWISATILPTTRHRWYVGCVLLIDMFVAH